MSGSDVTRDGLEGARPGREAAVGSAGSGPPGTGGPVPAGGRRGRRRRGGGEKALVPDAEFRSYYGKPIINEPVWQAPDIPGYLFCGGLSGAASVMAAGAQLTGRKVLARRAKVGALLSLGVGAAGLVHDLGRPGRFLNMLRTFKPTSPMSVGSWILAAYGPAAGVSAVCDVTGLLPVVGAAATAGAAVVGPAVAAYTGALVSDTAVPAWHDGYRQMPFVFVGSGATAAAGLGLAVAPPGEASPARRLAVLGSTLELASAKVMERRMGMVGEAYRSGRGGAYLRAGQVLTAAGVAGGLTAGRRNRAAAVASGVALMAASACTRWGIFHAGLASARDPRYTVVPQRQRLDERAANGVRP